MAAAPPELVLASGSPQRRAILERLGVRFRVESPDVAELTVGEPRAVVVENALRKARAVEGERVLAADTVVVLDGRILGKPIGVGEARAYLGLLAGRDHEVLSAAALREGGEERTALGATRVRFRALAPDEIEAYLSTAEWCGRAGGYAIQGRGAVLVEEIEGDYLAVVGLPVAAIARVAPETFAPSASAAPAA